MTWAILLLGLGLALIIAEVLIPSLGMLGILATLCIVAGGVFAQRDGALMTYMLVAGVFIPIVIVFRMLFFLNPASHWALGLSRVSVSKAVAGTIIGFAPWIALWTHFGAEIFVWFENQGPGIWIAIAVAIVAFIAFRKYRASMAQSVLVE